MAADRLMVDGERIDRARLALGLTREQLAQKAGISPNRVRLALCGGPVGLTVARALSRALRLRFADIRRKHSGDDVDARKAVDSPAEAQTGECVRGMLRLMVGPGLKD